MQLESKKNKSRSEILKTNKDQNNEKLRKNFTFVFSTKKMTKTATKGKKIRKDNIKKQKLKESNPYF